MLASFTNILRGLFQFKKVFRISQAKIKKLYCNQKIRSKKKWGKLKNTI